MADSIVPNISQTPNPTASLDRSTPQPSQVNRTGLVCPRTTSRLLLVIWFLWACVLFGGTLLSELDLSRTTSSLRDAVIMISHLGSSLLLVCAAWLWLLTFSRSPAALVVGLFAFGMTLGAIGDFFNGGVLQNAIPLPDPVLGGIAAFALGHIAYIIACVMIARRQGFSSPGKRWGAIGFWQLFAIVGWYFIVFRTAGATGSLLVWPALPYSLLLAGTAGVATHLALEDRRFFQLAAGGILFLISDLFLAFRMFNGDFPWATHAVWLTYGPAQMLIVFSIGTVARAEPSRLASGVSTP